MADAYHQYYDPDWVGDMVNDKIELRKCLLKCIRKRKLMSLASVVRLEFGIEEALQDFAAKYNGLSSVYKWQAEILLFVKTDDQSDFRKYTYPS